MRRDLVANADIEIKSFGARIDNPVKHLEANFQFGVFTDQVRDHGRDMVSAKSETAANAHPSLDRIAT